MGSSEQFSFCVAGCLHFGAHMRFWNSYKDSFHLMGQMATLKPDMLFLNGSEVDFALKRSDAVPLKSLSDKKDNEVFLYSPIPQSRDYIRSTRAHFDTLSRSVADLIFHLPSENSIPAYTSRESILYKEAEKAFLERASRYYAFHQFGSCFICLDSEEDFDARGRLGREQLEFLAKATEEAKAYPHVFCFIHLSAWRNNVKKISQWFEEVHPLLKKAGVKYVFGSCLHTYQHEEYDDIHYITTGACGNNVEPNFPHFLKINVSGKDVEVQVYRMGFPLYFPLIMQLVPQTQMAFIDSKIHEVSCAPGDDEKYHQAMGLIQEGNFDSAQKIWRTLTIFPDFNPERIPKSIVGIGDNQRWIHRKGGANPLSG